MKTWLSQRIVLCNQFEYSPSWICLVTLIIHTKIQPNNSVTSIETAQFVKNFFTYLDIVYTKPGMEDEIIIWENGTKKHKRKC